MIQLEQGWQWGGGQYTMVLNGGGSLRPQAQPSRVEVSLARKECRGFFLVYNRVKNAEGHSYSFRYCLDLDLKCWKMIICCMFCLAMLPPSFSFTHPQNIHSPLCVSNRGVYKHEMIIRFLVFTTFYNNNLDMNSKI